MHFARICLAATMLSAFALPAHADRLAREVPPWSDPDDVPVSSWMRSVTTQRAEPAIFAVPGKLDTRRGSMLPNARLPLYGAKRAPNCGGRWFLVGPLAWICSDVVDPSPEAPWSIRDRARWESLRGADGLPFRYFLVGQNGTSGYEDPANTDEASPAQEFEAGFIVAGAEERNVDGQRWVRTPHRRWLPGRDLAPITAAAFHGEKLDAQGMDFAWVVTDGAKVRKGPRSLAPASGTRARFAKVPWKEERAAPGGAMVRISDDGAAAEEWMLARDLAHPAVSARPTEVAADERWIDVDLATQTLVAYSGEIPVFATLVSTGRPNRASAEETETPRGSHRIWIKLATTNMDNLEHEDDEHHYSIEDVPYVQFFDHGVALHGAFWHKDFGHVHSHGCVNLAPLDAAWLFDWTSPHLPAGWSAVLPMSLEPGTLVRVR